MNSRSLVTLANLLALCFAMSNPACAQEETFEGQATVLEVQVPVNVTARNGEAVRSLTADDFKIFDEGQQREITGFRVIDLEVLELGSARSEIEAAVPAAARRHFLLLFDLSFSDPSSVVRAREAARRFVLNNLHPTDLVAVAIHTVESGARLIVTFTPDRAQVARAIDTLGAPRLLQLAHRRDPLRFVLEDLTGSSRLAQSPVDSGDGGGQTVQNQAVQAYIDVMGKQIAKMEKSFLRGRVQSWASSMGELARFLDSVEGRKHVVYFSEGFDGRLVTGRRPDASDVAFQSDQFNLERGNFWMVDTEDIYGSTPVQSSLGDMVKEFRRANCVIQTVNISGLRAGTVEEERASATGEDVLFYLSNETGGALFDDANDFGSQLERVLERSAVTYLLSFAPETVEFDGAYHRIKVKAELPKGARISFRQGYYAPRPFQQLHEFERELLASDGIASATPRNDLRIHLLSAAFPAGEESVYLPVIVEVDGESLLVGHEAGEMPVEIYTYVTDSEGHMEDFFTQMVTLNLARTREAFQRTGLKYYGHLILSSSGEHLVRVLVRNAMTGRTGVQTLVVQVPEYASAKPVLLPPFFLEQQGSWFLVREQRGEGTYEASVIYPFTVNGEPYIPAARPSLRPREEAEVCLVAYNLTDGAIQIDGTVVGEGGEEIGGASLDLVERTVTGIDGLDKLLASFNPNGLQEGSYRLKVELTDADSADVQVNWIPFSIVN